MSHNPDEAPSSIQVTSPVFSDGEQIPRRHSGEGDDVSPSLELDGVPEGTEALAIICDDPDAPTPEPWVHWVIYNIPGDRREIPEGLPRRAELSQPFNALQGLNSFGEDNIGYRGPMPPSGHGTHHYHFHVYALDQPLDLRSGAGKDQVWLAMQGHVLARGELAGTYERP